MRTDSEQHWRELILRRLHILTTLQVGWDGYRGLPVTTANASFALDILETCCRGEVPMPQLVPGTSGDLQLEWHGTRGDIELHLLRPHEVWAWHADAQTGRDGETVYLTNDFTLVARWVNSSQE